MQPISTDGGWNYTRVWFFRFVELLATPLIWGLTLGLWPGADERLWRGYRADPWPDTGRRHDIHGLQSAQVAGPGRAGDRDQRTHALAHDRVGRLRRHDGEQPGG